MNPRDRPSRDTSVETVATWTASCLSVTLAAVSFAQSTLAGAAIAGVGASVFFALLPRFRRGLGPFRSAAATSGAAVCSTWVVIRQSGLPWDTGISWSQAGGIGRPTAWLFTTTALCFGVGVLATGRLLVREGRARDALRGTRYRIASVLPYASCAGFVVVAVFPVGGLPVFAASHNIASWVAVGSLWLGMLGTPWLAGVSRHLRYFSAAGALVVFFTWLPNGLRFMRLITARPISMLAMELVVFPLCLVWLCWIAWEWNVPRREPPA